MGKILPYTKMIKHLGVRCPPVSVQMNITNRCACKCLMCKKHEWNLGDIDFSDAMVIIKQLSAMGTESIVFSGGDPLVYPQLAQLIACCENMAVGILTAGNVKFNDWDKIIDRVTWVRFSVDAYDKEQWKKIRGSTDKGYTFLCENLEKVAGLLKPEDRKKKVRLNMCILKDVNEDQQEKVAKWAESLGFDFMAHDTRVFEEFMKKKEHHDRVPPKCIIPFVHCVIEANGDVYPCCDVMNENAAWEDVNQGYRLGSLKDYGGNGIHFLWNSQEAHEKKTFFYKNRVKECETCPARYYPCNVEYEREEGKAIFL